MKTLYHRNLLVRVAASLTLVAVIVVIAAMASGWEKECPGSPYGELPTECDYSEYE